MLDPFLVVQLNAYCSVPAACYLLQSEPKPAFVCGRDVSETISSSIAPAASLRSGKILYSLAMHPLLRLATAFTRPRHKSDLVYSLNISPDKRTGVRENCI